MNIILVGGGQVGFFLAKSLIKNRHHCVLIEKDASICQEIAKALGITVINGDACEGKTLEDAGITRADVLVAVTGSDADNLVACQLAKQFFRIKRTLARVNDPQNERPFSHLGVDVPINSTSILTKIIEEEATLSDLVTLFSFKRGKLSVIRISLTDESPVANKKIQDIRLPANSVIVSILRGNDIIIPKGSTVLKPQDDLVALTMIENEGELFDLLVGRIDNII
ncbi:TrkA family potassium uptake protein [bacterium]|nr:TrkA family potassium uptake protein [bacterium]